MRTTNLKCAGLMAFGYGIDTERALFCCSLLPGDSQVAFAFADT